MSEEQYIEAAGVETSDPLEVRITELEGIVSQLRQDIVTITADHIQRLFNDEVLLDSLSQRIMVAGANAIAYKAKQSRNRAPEMVVVEGYIPGSIQAIMSEEGILTLSEQDKESGEWISGDAISDSLKEDQVRSVFLDLLISYGAEVGRNYYITDDVTVEEFRKASSARAMEIMSAGE